MFRILARFPLGLLQGAGALMGLVAFVSSASYRAKIDANLRRAGLPAKMRWVCALQSGCTIGELPFVWFGGTDRLLSKVRSDDLAVFEQACESGRGVLMLTPHLGAFEVAARYLAARAPITVLFKPPRQRPLVALLSAARNQESMRSVPTNLSGVRALLRALRAGEVVGLLPDQVPDAGQGEWADFFGEPAYTLTLPHRLAQQASPAVVIGACVRLGWGRGWQLHMETFDGDPSPQALNAAMEALVRNWPAQYLWGYNRYKQPRGAVR